MDFYPAIKMNELFITYGNIDEPQNYYSAIKMEKIILMQENVEWRKVYFRSHSGDQETARWVKCLLPKYEELSSNPQNLHKPVCDNECMCVILTPCLRWNVKTGSCLEAFQPVSLTHTAMDKKESLSQGRSQRPTPKMSSECHTCVTMLTYMNACIHTPYKYIHG